MRTDDLIESLRSRPTDSNFHIDEDIEDAIELIEAQRQTIANLRGQLSAMQRTHATTLLRLEQYKDAVTQHANNTTRKGIER